MKKIEILFLTLLIIFLIRFNSISENKPYAESELILASSTSEKISAYELRLYCSQFLLSEILPDSPSYKEKNGLKQAIKDLLAEKWLAKEARKKNLHKKAEIQKIIKNQEEDALLNKFDEKMLKDITVSEDEIKEYYNKHLNDFRQEEMVKFIHIFLRVESKDEEEVFKKMEEIHKRALEGEDFLELKKAYYPSSNKNKESEIITAVRGKFSPEVENAVFSTSVGQISPIFRSKYGWHIIKVVEKIESRIALLEEKKEYIKDKIFSEKKLKLKQEFENNLANELPAEINLDILKSNNLTPESVLAKIENKTILYQDVLDHLRLNPVLPLKDKEIEAIKQLLEKLINRERVISRAKKEGLDKTKDFGIIVNQRTNRILSNALLDSISVEKQWEDKEIHNYYKANKQKYFSLKEWKVREIRLNAPTSNDIQNPADLFLAREKIHKIMDEIHIAITTDMEPQEILKTYSAIPQPPQLIDYGWGPQGPRGHILDLAVQNLKKGEISSVQESRTGFHVFIVDDIKEPKPLTFEEAKQSIIKEFEMKEKEREREKLIKDAYDETKPSFNEKNLEQFKASF